MKIGRIPQHFPFTDVRPWWHNNKEIDAVAVNHETNQILCTECKWKTPDERDARQVIGALEKKSEYVKNGIMIPERSILPCLQKKSKEKKTCVIKDTSCLIFVTCDSRFADPSISSHVQLTRVLRT